MKTVSTPPTRAAAMRIFAAVLFISVVLSPGFARAQCLSVTANPGSAAQDASGVISFDSPGNVTSSNGVYAKAKATLTLLSGNTNQIQVTGFGFSIPSYAYICGVTVNVKRDANGIGVLAWIEDNSLYLVKNGVIAGNNMKQSGSWSGSDVTITYGSSGNLPDWNTTLTPADVNNSNFGVSFSASFAGVAALLPSINVDNISMTVYYNPVLPTHLLSFDASLAGSRAHLQWSTADEEEGEIIHLQRNSGTGWETIASFSMRSGNVNGRYTYDDILTAKGNYSYRLHILNNNGAEVFSAVRNIRYSGLLQAVAYPNPATNLVTVKHGILQSPLQVYNIFQQRLQVPVNTLNAQSSTIDVSALPPGMYFITLDTQRVSFLKQ